MRRKVGAILAFVGGFLVVLAVLAQFYAPGQLMRTPLDVNSTTHLSGTAQLSDGSGGMSRTPVIALQVTHTNSAKSDDDVAVFTNFTCLVKDVGSVDGCVSSDDPQDRLITATVDNFATDRVDAMSVNDPKYLPADAVPHEGLVNKWPFESEKKTYPYWDGTVGSAVDAVYDRTETVDGLRCYVYKVDVKDAPMQIADGVDGVYNDTKEISIEPLTGAIIDQTEHQEQTMTDGSPAVIVDIAFTDAQVRSNVDDYSAQADQLTLLTKTVPLVGYLVGIPLLIIGIVLLLLGRDRAEPEPEQSADVRTPTPSGAR